MTYGGDRTSDDCPGCGTEGDRCGHNGHSDLKQCNNSSCAVHQFWSIDPEADRR